MTTRTKPNWTWNPDMTPDVKLLIAGNWKMNGLAASLAELKTVAAALSQTIAGRADVLVCVPSTLIAQAKWQTQDTALKIGAQDCHAEMSGAHTGDISAEMLVDAGASAIIVGHSERRGNHGESNDIVLAKAQAAIRAGALAIICVGETAAERKSGKTIGVVGDHLAGSVPDNASAATVVIAYEPVWAIGTGLTATPDDVRDVHAFIRRELVHRFGTEGYKMRILYGGSVKAANAGELMAVANVDGALVGGASLKAVDFLGIIGV
jgi:triosephosphate isomerase (TIM)